MFHFYCYMAPLDRWLFRVKVSGESMVPDLMPGRLYWASGLLTPRAGDVVVFRNPAAPLELYVKKVNAISDGVYSVGGTVSASSSHEVPAALIVGKLIFRRTGGR